MMTVCLQNLFYDRMQTGNVVQPKCAPTIVCTVPDINIIRTITYGH
jgi:hypothetical protein